MARGKNIDKEYFPPVHTPPAKVEKLHGLGGKNEDTGGKNKDTGGKIKTGGKISYIFPQLKYSAQKLSQIKIVFSGKNMI